MQKPLLQPRKVNGQPLKTSDNYWRMLNTVAGRKLEFQVNSQPAPDGA